MRQLVRTATLVAVAAALFTALVALVQFGPDAYSQAEVLNPLLLFSVWCFLLTWPTVFLAGWLWRRTRYRAGGDPGDAS